MNTSSSSLPHFFFFFVFAFVFLSHLQTFFHLLPLWILQKRFLTVSLPKQKIFILFFLFLSTWPIVKSDGDFAQNGLLLFMSTTWSWQSIHNPLFNKKSGKHEFLFLQFCSNIIFLNKLWVCFIIYSEDLSITPRFGLSHNNRLRGALSRLTLFRANWHISLMVN